VYGVASAQFTIPVFPYITSALITSALPLLPSAPFPYTPLFQPFGSRMDTRRASKPSNSTPLHLLGAAVPLLRPNKPSAPRLMAGASCAWLPTIGPPHAQNQFVASGVSALATACVTAKCLTVVGAVRTRHPYMGGDMTGTMITTDSTKKAIGVKTSARMQTAMKCAASGSAHLIVGFAMVGLVAWRTTRLNNHLSPLSTRFYSRKGMPCSASS